MAQRTAKVAAVHKKASAYRVPTFALLIIGQGASQIRC
jgi:hypothetical protein